MKKIKKSFKFLSLGALAVSTPLISCGVTSSYIKNNDNNIKLSTKDSYLKIGGNIQILINNGAESAYNYNWTIETPINKVYVLPSGVVCASSDIEITEPISVTVCATSKSNEQQKGFITIDIPADTTETDNNFLGFRDNCIEFVDVYNEHQKVKIRRDSKYRYSLEKPIDVKAITEREDDHILMFSPIVRQNCRKTMQWYTWEKTPNVMIFTDGYQPGHDTETCPSIYFTTPRYSKTKLFVKFMCNGFEESIQPILTIDFNIWMPDAHEGDPSYFSYYPKDEYDKHALLPTTLQGAYSMKLFCPSSVSKGTYSNLLSTIYAFRNLHVYTDLSFEISMDAFLPDKFKNAFKINVSSVETIRTFDEFPMYKLCVSYSFDTSKIPTPAELEYQEINLCKLIAKDRKGSPLGWIQFEVEWI